MKPFTIETPVLTRTTYYVDHERRDPMPGFEDEYGTVFICRKWLSKRFYLGGAWKISFQLSTRKSKEAIAVEFTRHETCYSVRDEYASSGEFIDEGWLDEHMPLGLKEPVTLYVTLYIHEE